MTFLLPLPEFWDHMLGFTQCWKTVSQFIALTLWKLFSALFGQSVES